MSRTIVALLSIWIVTSCKGSNAESILYATGLEAPTFVAGQPLPGQDGFIAYGNVNSGAARVLAVAPSSGTQSVQISTALMSEEYVPGFYAGFYYRPINYDPLAFGTPIITVGVDVRVDPGSNSLDPNAGFQLYDSAGTYLAGLAIGTGALGVPGDPVGVFGDNNDGDTVSTLLGAIEFERFYRLVAQLDFAARTVQFPVDGTRFGTVSLSASNESTFGDADLVLSDRGQFDSVAYYDNYSITAASVPKPSSFVLAALGALCVIGWRAQGRCGPYLSSGTQPAEAPVPALPRPSCPTS
jgi:hypothetical protein